MHIVKTKRFGASVTTCIPHKEILRAELAALYYMHPWNVLCLRRTYSSSDRHAL